MSQSKFSKRDIAHMQKIYQQTMSLTATAKICDCHPSTVKKYRNAQKWVTAQQIRECRQDGNDTTLTPDIAIKLAAGWRLHMQDIDLCPVIGISEKQLKGWLFRNTRVTIIRTITKVGPDGKPLEGEGNVTRTQETVGLRDLRAREWANFEFSYIQKLMLLAERAEANKDFNTAFKIRAWILAKRLPKKFAESAININNILSQNQQQVQAPGTFSVDDLKLSLEARKEILAKIRERRAYGQERSNDG